MKSNHFYQQGQIAIVVLLVSAVLLTLGLSASNKTIIDTKVDTDEELLKEAFNTAESGINNYLNTDNPQGTVTYDAGDGSGAVVTSDDIGGANSLASEGPVTVNTNQMFWLVNHDTSGSVGTDYYSTYTNTIALAVDDGFSGALKIDYLYKDGTGYHVNRLGCNYGGSSTVIGFDATDTNCRNLTLTGSSLLVSITPIGSATNLTITGSANFPIQGQTLTSVGTVNDTVKTQVKTRYIYQIPAFMLESITARNIVQ